MAVDISGRQFISIMICFFFKRIVKELFPHKKFPLTMFYHAPQLSPSLNIVAFSFRTLLSFTCNCLLCTWRKTQIKKSIKTIPHACKPSVVVRRHGNFRIICCYVCISDSFQRDVTVLAGGKVSRFLDFWGVVLSGGYGIFFKMKIIFSSTWPKIKKPLRNFETSNGPIFKKLWGLKVEVVSDKKKGAHWRKGLELSYFSV